MSASDWAPRVVPTFSALHPGGSALTMPRLHVGLPAAAESMSLLIAPLIRADSWSTMALLVLLAGRCYY